MRRLSNRWQITRYTKEHGIDTLGYLPTGTRRKSEWMKSYNKKRLRTLRYSAKKEFLIAIQET
jgi:hypothetical protein